ncbi:FUSC family protein [Aeromonas veronii]|nr:FUSC family protein [Aeromonas veronii]
MSDSLWHRTPWGKADGGQWRYALRNSLAMCLSLWLAFVLQLDSPYWAMSSAAVVSFPTVGGVISKSLGRVVGSLIGAMAAVVITGLGISDPWLFSFLIALWLGVCTYIANHYQNNVSYAFALSGYTAAIVAFSCVNVTDPQHIFDIAQARVSEITIGILCSGLMMMILPSTSDSETLIESLRKTQTRLLEHARLLWLGTANPDVRSAYEGLIGQILTMNVLRIQAVWSHHRLRRQNKLLNFLLHRQLRLISLISSQRRMLHNWPEQPAAVQALLVTLLAELGKPECDKYRIARLLAPLVQTAGNDYRLRTFWLRLRDFCWNYLECQRWLNRLEKYEDREWPTPPRHTSLTSHTDTLEAAYNGGRTFITVLLGCAFWIHSQWDGGSSALTMLAIGCVINAITPAQVQLITIFLKAILWLSLVCFVVKFGLMIRISDFWLFCALLFPALVTMHLFKLQQVKQAVLWTQLIVLLGAFLAITNPPSYDYQQFITSSISQALGVVVVALAYQLLRPSSDRRKSRRIIRSLRRHFIDQLAPKPQQSESQFESLTYHSINQLSLSEDQAARAWVLRWGVALLNCSHIVWQLRHWRGEDQPLYLVRDNCIRCLKGILTEGGVQHASLDHTLAELARISERLAEHNDYAARDLAGMVWRLHCALSQLQQALPAESSTA